MEPALYLCFLKNRRSGKLFLYTTGEFTSLQFRGSAQEGDTIYLLRQ